MNICKHRKGPNLPSPLCRTAAAPALREAGREGYFGQSGGSPAALTNMFDEDVVSPTEGFQYVESVRSSQRKRCLPPLSSQIYYHGEPISVNVHVTNNTNKTVKKMKISGRPTHPFFVSCQLVALLTAALCFGSAAVRRHLPVQHGSVQVSRGHRGVRVSPAAPHAPLQLLPHVPDQTPTLCLQ